MARIPRIQQRRSQVQGLPNVRVDPGATEDNFGVDFSGAAESARDTLDLARERANTAQVMEADSQLTQFENDALYDPENGALNRRGKNAFGAPEEVMEQFDKRAGEIRTNLRGPQLEAFNKLVNQRRQQIDRTLQRHVSSEIQTYEQEQADSLINNSQIAAANHYNEPDRIQTELRRQRGAVMARAQDLGWSPEQTQEALQTAESKTHAAVIDRMSANDTQGAMRYYLQHGPEMSPDVRSTYEQTISDMRNRQKAETIADSLSGTGTVGVDGVWERMIQRESNGQQLDAEGNPITSDKGAIGVAQIMPDTGPEAARLAGLEWDEERFRTDEQYNETLGRAYFDAQNEKYNDPILAAAAYNAGPGQVDKWIKDIGDPRTDDMTHDEWADRVPFEETREYVKTVGQGLTDTEVSRSDQLAAVNTLPSNIRDQAKDRLEEQWAVQDRREEEVYQQAQEAIEGGSKVSDLPVQLRNNLSNENLNALRSRARELSGVEPEMDWGKWTEISMMEREQLAAIEDPYTELRPVLDDQHYNKAVSMISEAKGIGGEIDTSSTLTFNQRVKNTAMQSNIIPGDRTPSQYTEEQALTFARFQNESSARIEAAERDRGRKLTGEEQQQVIDDIVTERVMIDQTFGDDESYLWAIDEDEMGSAYIPIDDIPDPDNQEIRNLMLSNGVVPSDDRVQRAFAQYRLNNREAFQEIIRGE